MTGKTAIPWLRLTGWAVVIHLILIALSIAEVLVYASLVNPGQPQGTYESHAEISAPIVSIVFGIVLFLLFARRLAKKRSDIKRSVGVWLAYIYIIIDLVILVFSGTDWAGQAPVLLVSFVTKVGASYMGAMSVKIEPTRLPER